MSLISLFRKRQLTFWMKLAFSSLTSSKKQRSGQRKSTRSWKRKLKSPWARSKKRKKKNLSIWRNSFIGASLIRSWLLIKLPKPCAGQEQVLPEKTSRLAPFCFWVPLVSVKPKPPRPWPKPILAAKKECFALT